MLIALLKSYYCTGKTDGLLCRVVQFVEHVPYLTNVYILTLNSIDLPIQA